MAFNEKLKVEVRKAGHFSCCICHSHGVEIHHLVPQCDDGLDTFENAAPLCPSCHETYGGNPTKRKFITEARDFWYETCEKRYSSTSIPLSDIKKLIASSINEEFSDLKKMLSLLPNKEAIADDKVLGEVEVVNYLMTKYHKEDTAPLEFFNWIWNDNDFPEIRLQFKNRYGELFFEIVCKYAMHEASMDLNGFTEENFDEAVNNLRSIVSLMCLLSDGYVDAKVMTDGDIVWRRIA
ncbi:MAG: hypothetical protein ACJAT7_003794 [Psychromonas sp.]|jgi:hypothetical protein|uniref:HNH endonuclease n=1 Tax=Psychromonas sp. TaxID=1884585 RepID=UPI0039E58B39